MGDYSSLRKVAISVLIAGCALTVLHLLDIQKTGGTDSVFSVILSEFYASPDAPIIQVLKIFTYLELVFSLSAMFSASLFLCLRIVSDGETPCNPVDGPSLDAKLDLSGSIRDHWFWMLRHWNISLQLCYVCIVAQISVAGWINRGIVQEAIGRWM